MTQLQSNAAAVGIKLNLKPEPFNQVIALAGGNCVVTKSSCNWDLANWGGGWDYVPDYYPTGEELFMCGVPANSGGYCNKQNDSLINATLTNSSIAAHVHLAGLPHAAAPDGVAAERGLRADRDQEQPQGRHSAAGDAWHQPGELVFREVTGSR